MNEKAILAGVQLNSDDTAFDYSMQELHELAVACELNPVGQITQKLPRINNKYVIGTGKIEELQALLGEKEASIIIFDEELSPMQIRNLEEKLECDVVDRTMLILDIFSKRAKTRESQLQVEVARLKYMLPRLVGSRESLGRQGGGVGLTNRGSGETKLELDRRKIEERIAKLNKELAAVVDQRHIQRKKRQKNDQLIVSLVGYTNAGKSTIMNTLLEKSDSAEEKQVFEKNMLFATLETSVRHIKLATNKEFLLTDTVGFIDKLPHHLVKAFRSTLEEVTEADLLVHVIDCANPNHEQHRRLTNDILKQIGAEDIPMIYAYNKADLADMTYPVVQEDKVFMAAKQHVGTDELLQLISDHIFKNEQRCEMKFPYSQGQLVAYFNEHSRVLSEEYEEDGIRMIVECSEKDARKYGEFAVTET